MRAILGLLVVVVLGLVAAVYFGLIDVSKTREGALPTVKVEGGQAPAFDVRTANVSVGTTNTTVEVPTVKTETKTVETPTVHVDKPH